MARVWFIVAVILQTVYANEININNCDDCVRKGSTWCNEIGSEHCSRSANDDWCPTQREKVPPMPDNSHDQYRSTKERRLYIDIPGRVQIPYASPNKLQANVSIVESTQTKNIVVSVHHTECDDTQCIVTIEAIPRLDFCLSTGGIHEHVYAKVSIENMDEVMIKYHIACACMCSKTVEVDSMKCNGYGNFSCGVCACRNGWSGEYCETKLVHKGLGDSSKGEHGNNGIKNINGGLTIPNVIGHDCTVVEKKSPKCNYKGDYSCGSCRCDSEWSGPNCETKECLTKRGDLQCTNPAKDSVECSGNGYCGPCDSCICYSDREGSQYFDEENYCTDLCMVANYCDVCLANTTLGECSECNYLMTKMAYNETVTQRVDSLNRKIWVKCNETIDDCYIEYWAMKSDNDEISIMVQKSCNDVEAGYVSAGPEVPLIMGILGIIAAVAAVAGVLAWKHFTAVPPLPLSDPEYQNIDAEDCTGENPLYKSPMSSFKNPTYGKW